MKSIFFFLLIIVTISCNRQVHQTSNSTPAIYSKDFLIYENKDFPLQLDDFSDCNKERFLEKKSLENLKMELTKSNLNVKSINCEQNMKENYSISTTRVNLDYEKKSALTEKSSFIFIFKDSKLKSYIKTNGKKCNGFWCFQEETEQLQEYYIWKMYHLAIDISPLPEGELMYYCLYKINSDGQIEVLDELEAKRIIEK